MKTTVVLIFGLLVVGIYAVHFDKCHDELPNLPTLQPVKLDKILGKWYFIRKGYVANSEDSHSHMGLMDHIHPAKGLETHDESYAPENVKKHECMSTTLLKVHDGTPDTINHVTSFRKFDHAISHTGTMKLTLVGTGLYDNNFSFSHKVEMPGTGEMKEFYYQLKLVETDEGKTWSIWLSCIEKFGHSMLFWIIESRTPTMHPNTEKMLMEKVHKYGGPELSEQIKMIQSNCDA